MVEVKRCKNCILVYEKCKKRGIAFPPNTLTKRTEFEKQVLAYKVRFGDINIVKLSYNYNNLIEYKPLLQYLKNKEETCIFIDYDQVKQFYEYFFSHAVPELKRKGIEYVFMG